MNFNNRKNKYITSSAKETKELAEEFAKYIYKKNNKNALIVGLEGELGGGKTTFLQGFAKGLKIKEKILSPTFVLLKKYKIRATESYFNTFYHLDCYRVESKKIVDTLNLKEIIKDSKNLLAIEWYKKIKEELPKKNRIEIKFKFLEKNKREIKILFK